MKKQNGITLIALVITIIVLLILAGVSISMVTGENGLISKAGKANKETAVANDTEELKLILSDYKISEYADSTLQTVGEYFEKKLVDEDVRVFENGVAIVTRPKTGNIFLVTSEEIIYMGDEKIDFDLLIYNKETFLDFIERVNSGNSYDGKIIYLLGNINVENETIDQIGKGESKFEGTFKGNGGIISNANIKAENGRIGLFENFTGTIDGLKFTNSVITLPTGTEIQKTFLNCFAPYDDASEYILKNCSISQIAISVNGTETSIDDYDFSGSIIVKNNKNLEFNNLKYSTVGKMILGENAEIVLSGTNEIISSGISAIECYGNLTISDGNLSISGTTNSIISTSQSSQLIIDSADIVLAGRIYMPATTTNGTINIKNSTINDNNHTSAIGIDSLVASLSIDNSDVYCGTIHAGNIHNATAATQFSLTNSNISAQQSSGNVKGGALIAYGHVGIDYNIYNCNIRAYTKGWQTYALHVWGTGDINANFENSTIFTYGPWEAPRVENYYSGTVTVNVKNCALLCWNKNGGNGYYFTGTSNIEDSLILRRSTGLQSAEIVGNPIIYNDIFVGKTEDDDSIYKNAAFASTTDYADITEIKLGSGQTMTVKSGVTIYIPSNLTLVVESDANLIIEDGATIDGNIEYK